MLSQLGFDYLKRHKRQFKMARADVVDVLQRSGVPLFEPVIDFQLRFGGCRIAEDFVFGFRKTLAKGAGLKSVMFVLVAVYVAGCCWRK